MPARIRFLALVLRRSWNIRPGDPASVQALTHARLKSFTGRPSSWKNRAVTICPVSCSISCFRASCASRIARSCGIIGNIRPLPDFVWPGSSRSQPSSKSTCRHSRLNSSPRRQPVICATRRSGRRYGFSAAATAASSPSSKNPSRTLFSCSISNFGTSLAMFARSARLNARLNAASSRFTDAAAAPSASLSAAYRSMASSRISTTRPPLDTGPGVIRDSMWLSGTRLIGERS